MVMKKALSLIISSFCTLFVWASEGERLYIQTDKENYLAGELVWMKLITTSDEGLPSSLSRVGYVELVDETQIRVKTRIDLTGGVGSGTIVLPSSLHGGYYRLVGYTRYMRGEGPAVFFEKWIGVINPLSGEVSRGNPQLPLPEVRQGMPIGNSLTISGGNATYSPRSQVRLYLSDIPLDIHTLSVSVVSPDLLNRLPVSKLGNWKKELPANSLTEGRGNYQAEYEGQVITGKIISTQTGEQTYSPDIIPMVAFPGNGINLFTGKAYEDGRVVFSTTRTTGLEEIATTMQAHPNASYRIDLDDPYTPEDLSQETPSFPIDEIDKQALLRQSLALQLQYTYVGDSLNVYRPVATQFFDKPDQTYLMKEWTRFATMDEVVTEYVKQLRFTRNDGQRYLSVISKDFGIDQTHTLVLLDGIPIIDHEIIYRYNPLLLSRIDVYYDKFAFGKTIFNGIVAFHTEHNSYPELQPDQFTQILSYPPIQPHRRFYSPDYFDDEQRSSHLPDYRHTLYWDADLRADQWGRAQISFFTSDLKGEYQVLVEGLTAQGEPLSAVYTFQVR